MKLALIGLFFAVFAAFAPRNRREAAVTVRGLDVGMLGLAALRVGRLISYDRVTEPVREPFTETEGDKSGAGDTIVPQPGAAVRETLGELISCPICSGTWAAAAMAYFLRVAPVPGRFFFFIISATGVADVLNAPVESLEWNARAERMDAGQTS